MIINTNSPAPYSNVSHAHARHGKRSAARTDADPTQTDSTDDQSSLVSNQNLISANPPLQDVDAVIASLKSASQGMLGQPSLAMLAQAGSISPSALQLLQE
jgi:hypothetical protein